MRRSRWFLLLPQSDAELLLQAMTKDRAVRIHVPVTRCAKSWIGPVRTGWRSSARCVARAANPPSCSTRGRKAANSNHIWLPRDALFVTESMRAGPTNTRTCASSRRPRTRKTMSRSNALKIRSPAFPAAVSAAKSLRASIPSLVLARSLPMTMQAAMQEHSGAAWFAVLGPRSACRTVAIAPARCPAATHSPGSADHTCGACKSARGERPFAHLVSMIALMSTIRWSCAVSSTQRGHGSATINSHPKTTRLSLRKPLSTPLVNRQKSGWTLALMGTHSMVTNRVSMGRQSRSA